MAILNFIDGVAREYAEDKRAQVNRQFQAEQAEINRDFQREMYDRQMDDNIAWRTHQEQYNSPEAQMSRYRDAGINPMYAITGNGQNTVTSPMSMSGGYGSSPSGGSNTSSIDSVARRAMEYNRRVQENQMQNNTLVSEAQAAALQAQADEHSARAQGIRYENSERRYNADVYDALRNIYTDLYKTLGDKDKGKMVPFAEAEAFIRANAREYDYIFDGMNFTEAKDRFTHLRAVREFERDLQEHQRNLFEHELSQAQSASQVFSVAAKWAVPNQWINAGGQVLGAAASMVGAVKGTSLMPTHSRNYSESYGDHTSYVFNKKVGNEIQSPESMMRVTDINY